MDRAQRTRRRLQDEAVRLFAARGYDHVTVEEIAHAAGVSHMTFFRHFPTKVSVLLDDPYDPIIGEMVAATDPTLPPIERIRQGLVAATAHVDEADDAITKDRIRILVDNDLVAHAWGNNQATEQVIVDALTATGVPHLDARIAAGAFSGALMAALTDWAEHDDSGPLAARVRLAVDTLASQGVAPDA